MTSGSQTRTKPSPPGGGIKYELDKHYTPWLPKELTTGDRELFKRCALSIRDRTATTAAAATLLLLLPLLLPLPLLPPP
jgi:hypothetical protein